jgi:histidyl-tRNA synthetase
VELDLAQRSLQAQMKGANSLGARFSVIVGEDELSSGVFTVKDMMSGEQAKVCETELGVYLEKRLLGTSG